MINVNWQVVFNVLASLSVPSLLLNIYLAKQARNYKKWEAKKDLDLKNIELEEEMARGQKEYNEKYPSKQNEYRYSYEQLDLMKKEAAGAIETSSKKMKKIFAEMDYLRKVAGEKDPFAMFKERTFWQKIKEFIKFR